MIAHAETKVNIMNANQIPVQTPADKLHTGMNLSLQFPVSSGNHHRNKEAEWMPIQKDPVTKRLATKQLEAKNIRSGSLSNGSYSNVVPQEDAFPEKPHYLDAVNEVSQQLSAMKILENNPNDTQAKNTTINYHERVDEWANRTELPGQFTGSTNAKVLTVAQLTATSDSKKQAWAKKDIFHKARPVTGGIGMCLLQKMGWNYGEGLGKNGEGKVEPLSMDVKIDRKGLAAINDMPSKAAIVKQKGNPLDLAGKHPVSALLEVCNKNNWGPPNFVVVHESGPDHQKNFLFKVTVNGQDYRSAIASNNKKQAKAQCATACLQELGLIT